MTALIFHYDPAILHLSIDGELVQTTAEHPFFTQEQGWVDASKLWPGARVRKLNGSYGLVQGLEVVQQGQTMYNLTVAQAHTFFVGAEQWLVHNSCPIIISHPSQKAARRAADREAGMGKHGIRQELPPEVPRPGSRSSQGDPGTRTRTRNPENGREVHHDPYGHNFEDDIITPHYGVDYPDGRPTSHHTYPSPHNPRTNR